MAWSQLNPSHLDWVQLPAGADALRGPVDPYLIWADLTDFAGFGGIESVMQKVPVAVQVWAAGHIQAVIGTGLIESPAIYAASAERCFTGYVHPRNLATLAAHGAVRRLELGLPLKSLAGRRDVLQVPASNPKPERPGAKDCVVGVVDFGCAFLNRSFWADAAKPRSRVVAVWQQDVRDTPGTAVGLAGWETPSDFGYGRELGRTQINNLLTAMGRDAGQPAAELARYQALGYLYDGHGRLEYPAHGSFVMDVAAGRVQALQGAASAKPSADDCASDAQLIFVDLPRPEKDDSSGAPLCVHIVDALHYIVDRAGDATNIVINLSIGAQAGPHDGSSLVEEAIDELVENLRGNGRTLAVVISAGNGAMTKCHAEGPIAPGGQAEFMWHLLPNDDTDNYLELWYDSVDPAQVSVELTPPVGPGSGPVGVGEARTLEGGGGIVGAVLHCREPAVGNGPMTLLAMAPTKATQRRPDVVQHGQWKVTVRNLSSTVPVKGFFAWVERDEWPGVGPAARRQSVLEDVGSNQYVVGSRGTLNNMATGLEPVVVAACDLLTAKIAAYSGQPVHVGDAKRQRGADVMAAADQSPSAPGLEATGGLSGQRTRLSGTSVAAPVVSRAIVHVLCCAPSSKGNPLWSRETLVDALLAAEVAASNPAPAARGVPSALPQPGVRPRRIFRP